MAMGSHPETIGPYRVLEQLGRGGMGIVYLAEERGALRRRVAIKVLSGHTERDARRAEVERRVLARLEHPGIAALYGGGSTAEGTPYLVLELVDGVPLAEYLGRRRLPLAERLQLFLDLSSAVQHAHVHGVVHRDLKPGNVLVGETGERAVVKVIDFGVAQLLDPDPNARDTEARGLVGSPQYAAPEQLRGAPQDVDTRADIYALGLLLYEVVAGAPVRDPARWRGASPEDLVELAARRPPSLTEHGAPAELDWVVHHALEFEPAERYPTVGDLMADLRALLAGVPVSVAPPSRWYPVRMFLRRHRPGVAAASVLLAATAVAWIAASIGQVRAEASVRRFDCLAVVEELREIERDAAGLGPPWPRHIAAMEQWVRRADALVDRLPQLRSLHGALDSATDQDCFLHRTLGDTLAQLAAFQSTGSLPRVRARLSWARELAARQAEDRSKWDRVRAELATDPRFRGFDLPDQPGLVPLGKDPQSGLQEFAELRSGSMAQRDPTTHRARCAPATGIVLVLLPGGTFTMGARRETADRPNSDPLAETQEGPPHRVELAPFFLAKFELTHGQWLRLGGGPPPARFKVGMDISRRWKVTEAYPVEGPSWTEIDALLTTSGLNLPTESQWEYAARAGTSTPWYTGDKVTTLRGYENVLDMLGGLFDRATEHLGWRDGHLISAPVGEYLPNPFGLHDMLGNVNEWCRDLGRTDYPGEPRPGDGLRAGGKAPMRVVRGGGFLEHWHSTRVSHRGLADGRGHAIGIGVRPAREVVR